MKGSSLNIVFRVALKKMKALSCCAASCVSFTFCTNEVSSSQEWILGHLVRVKVTLRLASSHSVHSSAEALVGLMTKLYSAYSVCWIGLLLSFGALTLTRLRVGLLSWFTIFVVCTYLQTPHTHTHTYIYTCFVLVYIHVFFMLNIIYNLEYCTRSLTVRALYKLNLLSYSIRGACSNSRQHDLRQIPWWVSSCSMMATFSLSWFLRNPAWCLHNFMIEWYRQ
jgi:hypothetical protein